MEEPYQSRPGWIAFVAGECFDEEYANPNYDWLKQMTYRAMYRFVVPRLDYYYHYGYNTFEFKVFQRIDIHHVGSQRPANLRNYIIYFYNRKLIIQMTYIPHFYPGQKISILIHKSSEGIEIHVFYCTPAITSRQ